MKRLLLTPLVLLTGCGGGAVDGFHDGECGEERRPLALGEVSPLGFSAEDVLAFASGHFETGLAWSVPTEFGGLILSPEAGETVLSLDIGSDVVRVTFVVSGSPDSAMEPADYCSDFIEIETELHLSSGNGAFDDTFPLVLRANDAAAARATLPLEPGLSNGSFDLEETGPLTVSTFEAQADRSELTNVAFDLNLAPGRVFGEMNADFNLFFGDGPTGAVTGARVPFGRLEVAGCYDEDFGGLLDAGQAVSRLAARLDGERPLEFFWSGDVPNRVLLATIPASEFCLNVDGTAGLEFATDLELRDPETEELVGTWPLTGRSVYDRSGAFQRVVLGHDAHLVDTFSPTDLGSTIGDFGVDFSDADAVGLEVELELGAADAWSGRLTLHAIQTVAPESSEIAATAVISQLVK